MWRGCRRPLSGAPSRLLHLCVTPRSWSRVAAPHRGLGTPDDANTEDRPSGTRVRGTRRATEQVRGLQRPSQGRLPPPAPRPQRPAPPLGRPPALFNVWFLLFGGATALHHNSLCYLKTSSPRRLRGPAGLPYLVFFRYGEAARERQATGHWASFRVRRAGSAGGKGRLRDERPGDLRCSALERQGFACLLRS